MRDIVDLLDEVKGYCHNRSTCTDCEVEAWCKEELVSTPDDWDLDEVSE